MKTRTPTKTWMIAWGFSAIIATLSGCTIDIDTDGTNNSTPKVYGSGRLVTVEPNTETFTRVEFAESLEVVILQGNENRVSIQLDDNLQKYLIARTSGDTLTVTLAKGFDYVNETVIVMVTMPSINSIDAEDDVSVRFSGFEFDGSLDITIGDESSVQGTAPMAFQNLTIDVLEESTITLSGNAEFVSIVATEECNVNLMNTSVRNANVILDEESVATINVTDTLSYDLNDESVLRYYGRPTLGNTHISDESKAINQGTI
ncbi:MAG: hypothetical protein GY847_06565 [Proteobacteria bacterium]|nr:hypothetical protein [Pseudomonadota bacterium]